MKKLFTVTILASFIVACGGGESSNANAVSPVESDLTKTQIEEKFNLPPEPDPKVNNSTILGVDSNNNDIRDDWERAIAFEHYKNPTMMNINNLSAQNTAALIKAYEAGDKHLYQDLSNEEGNLIDCAYFYNDDGFGSKELSSMDANTKERKLYLWKQGLAITKVIGAGFHGLTNAEMANICPRYKK